MGDALAERQQQPVVVGTCVVANVAVCAGLRRKAHVRCQESILRQKQYDAGKIALNDKLIQSRSNDLGATDKALILEPWLTGHRSSRFNLFLECGESRKQRLARGRIHKVCGGGRIANGEQTSA